MVESTTTTKEKNIASGRYIEGIGRRKTSVARVRIFEVKGNKKKSFIVNDMEVGEYFPTEEMELITREAFSKVKAGNKFSVSVHVRGGGIHGQSEALRLGLARALVTFNEEWRKKLKKGGLLKRDPRMKERKKFGRKKARKSGQWSKR